MIDTDVIKQVTYLTLENGDSDATGTTLQTTMFSISQILASLNQRQWRFLRDTGCIATRTTIAAPAGQQRYTLPADYVDTLRLTFTPNGESTYALQRVDAWEIDNGQSDANYSSGEPVVWNESNMPTRTLQVAPLPINSGTLGQLYVAVNAALTGLGVALTVPDIFSWAITWGVVSDLLSSDGEGLDVKRAQYAESRYDQGVELCRIMIKGEAS